MNQLKPRPFGRTGLRVTPLGLADLAFRADEPPTRGQMTADDVERAFYEHGLTTFLVASMMTSICEGVRRLIKAGHRDALTLISLSGFVPFAWAQRRTFEENARAVGTDHLDVYLQGWVRGHWHVAGRSWPFMRSLKETGRVRAIGFSCHDRQLALSLARELEPDVMMLRYNAAHRGVEREVFEPLAEKRPAIIAYTSTRWGMLLRPVPSEGFPAPLRAPECYRFVLAHPSVDMAFCAAHTLGELIEDIEGVNAGPPEPARMEEIRRFGDAVHKTAKGGGRFMFRQG